MLHLDLFSGIGGFSIGFERAGMRTTAFCEVDPFARAVLAKHWPGVPIYDDIRTLKGKEIGPVEIISGGFPCQDIRAKPNETLSVLPASVPAYGSKWRESSQKLGPGSSSSKIQPDFAVEDWIRFSGFSLRSGIMRNGIVSPLAPLMRRTKETGSTLWPTPTASRRSGLQSHGKNALLGPVNPTFLEWLMGFEINHTDAEF